LYNNQTNFLKNFSVLTSDVPMIIYEPWVNFQKKYEFNPPHRHNGVISFVIWLQIPFFIEAELKNPSIQDSRNPIPGCFNFHYTDALGTIQHYNIQADKTMENTLLLFPSTLNHSVNPFYTSDEYRISVSGNIKLDVN